MSIQRAGSELGQEATLGHSAAKLLLHLLRLGDGRWPATHLQQGAGLPDWRSFRRARNELVEKGLWDEDAGKVVFPVAHTPVAPVSDTPVAPVAPVSDTPVAPVADTGIQLDVEPALVPTVIPINWRERVMQADLLPGGGDPHQRTSDFQARRNTQVDALQGAWQEMFNQTLTRDSAKDLLQLTDNFAEDVFDAMETCQARNIQSPRGYLIKMLQNKRQTVRPATIGTPSRGSDDEAGSDDNYYLTKPTEKTAKMNAWLAAHPEVLNKYNDEDDD